MSTTTQQPTHRNGLRHTPVRLRRNAVFTVRITEVFDF